MRLPELSAGKSLSNMNNRYGGAFEALGADGVKMEGSSEDCVKCELSIFARCNHLFGDNFKKCYNGLIGECKKVCEEVGPQPQD